MGNHVDLGDKFKTIVPNVYFQPPETIKLSYPCVVYQLSSIDHQYADNKTYIGKRRYQATLITKDPADDRVDKIVDSFELCKFDRFFTANNLNHNVFVIYW